MHIISGGGIGHELDPAGTAIRTILGKPTTGRTFFDPAGLVLQPKQTPPAPPAPPTQDVAANAARQVQDQMRRRRGVYSNIFAGGNAATPTVASRSVLGS